MSNNNITFEQMPNAISLLMERVEEVIDRLHNQQPPIVDRKKPLNVEETAAYLNRSKKTIYNMASRQEIPHYKKGMLYFFRDELDEWIKSGRVPTKENAKAQAISRVADSMSHNR